MNDRFQPRNPADLADLVAQQPLAWLVYGTPDDLRASLAPVRLEVDAAGKPQRLLGHLSRSDPNWHALEGSSRAMVLLLGANGYISPSWRGDRAHAPGWNYACAVFDVQIKLHDSKDATEQLLHELTDEMENGRPGAWLLDELGAGKADLVSGTIGFSADIQSVRNTFKLGQDQADDAFSDILQGLRAGGQEQLLEWMHRFGEDRDVATLQQAGSPPTAIDPDIKRFVDAVCSESRRLTGGRELDWPQKRDIAEQARLPWRQGGAVMARTEDIVAQTEAGPVRLRIHDPSPTRDKPVLGYIHGGGWAMFSLDTHDRVMRELAARADMVVVGIDYALAPEAKYPVALNQVVAVVRWLRTHGAEHGLDATRLALGGDSAGGALSTGAALKLRDAGEAESVRGILSYYGAFSPECSAHARHRYGTPEDMLTGAEVDMFWDTYLGHIRDRSDPYASPMLASLEGLPPFFLCVAECDVLAEQNLQMAGNLLAAEVPVDVKVYGGAPHSFIEAMSISAVAVEALDDGAAWLRRVLGHAATP